VLLKTVNVTSFPAEPDVAWESVEDGGRMPDEWRAWSGLEHFQFLWLRCITESQNQNFISALGIPPERCFKTLSAEGHRPTPQAGILANRVGQPPAM